MKCKNCKCEINVNNLSFCTNCGASLEADPAAESTGKKNRAVIVTVIVIVLLIAAGIAAAVFFGLFGSDDDARDDKKSKGDAPEKENVTVIVEGFSPVDDPESGKAETYYDETRPIEETTEKIADTVAPETENDETEPAETEPAETEPEEPVWEGSDRVVIANGGLNMRKSPDRNAAIVNCITNGAIVTVEKVQDNWAYVTYGGKKGWCSCDYLYVPIEANTAPLYKATVRCSGNMEMTSDGYAEDDLVYTDVANGTVVQVYEIDGDRAYIKYNNILGWCPTKYLERK